MLFSRFLLLLTLVLSVRLQAQPGTKPSTSRQSINQLRNELNEIARSAQGRVGMAATLLETGESVYVRGTEQFPMQSVYKLPIGMAVLHQVDQGKLTLNQTVHVAQREYVSERQHSPIRDQNPTGVDLSVSELVRYAVSESDGSASDVLLRLVGGAPVVMDYLRSLGITGIRVINTEKEIGSDNAVQYRNWATPKQAVTLLQALQEGRGLTKTSRAFLLRLMTDTPTGLHRIKGLLPAGTVVAHKTGSSRTVYGVTAATNNVGLITLPNRQTIAIAVFVSDAKADDKTREDVIARIARAVWEYWQ
ncbi:class A beta-lactamase [Spirosoma fluminis]